MKATGIVRQIDDLGRIVIPREIRKTMDIQPGTNMEIYITDTGEIVLKKYGTKPSAEQLLQDLLEGRKTIDQVRAELNLQEGEQHGKHNPA